MSVSGKSGKRTKATTAALWQSNTTPSVPAVELKRVSVSLAGRSVLNDVSFAVNMGECVVLAGENGAGKSTLARVALGLLAPARGQAFLFGVSARAFSDWQRVGYVSQLPPSSSVRFPATALELVAAGCVLSAHATPAGMHAATTPHSVANTRTTTGRRIPVWAKGRARRQKALECLALTGASELAHRQLGEMSGGQRQRVRLAAALASDPDLLVLDEPTTGLDPEATHAFCDLVSELHGRLANASCDTAPVSNQEKMRGTRPASAQAGGAGADRVSRSPLSILMVSHDPVVLGMAGARVTHVENGRVA